MVIGQTTGAPRQAPKCYRGQCAERQAFRSQLWAFLELLKMSRAPKDPGSRLLDLDPYPSARANTAECLIICFARRACVLTTADYISQRRDNYKSKKRSVTGIPTDEWFGRSHIHLQISLVRISIFLLLLRLVLRTTKHHSQRPSSTVSGLQIELIPQSQISARCYVFLSLYYMP